jgi:hypothetical protein
MVNMERKLDIGEFNRNYINELRGASILRVMMVHLGLSWFYLPYTSYIGALLPLLFFVSGAVSFFSYRRAHSTVTFVYKRLISILIPYYLLVLIIAILCMFVDNWQLTNITHWLLISPDTSGVPFLLGQVWFLQSLTLITLITLPVYYLSSWSVHYLSLFALLALTLIGVNSYIDIHYSFIFLEKIDLYLAFSNGLFFILGSLYFIYEDKINRHIFLLIALTSLSLGLLLNWHSGDFSLGRHMASPDLIYFFCSFGLISLLLVFKQTIQTFLNRITILKNMFFLCSKNAYSLYLLHTLVLAAVENYIFKEPLTGDFMLAILKMLIVIGLTIAIAPVFTHISNIIINRLKS